MNKSPSRLLGAAAVLLMVQILAVNALLGARGNPAVLTTPDTSPAVSAEWAPDASFSDDNGRFDIVLIPKNSNYHLMIDTAEGRIWQARFQVDGSVQVPLVGEFNTFRVSNWRRVEVHPAPPGKSAAPGRFRVHSSFEEVKETFLHDTATGHIYLMLVMDEQQNVMFQRLPVEGL